MDWKRYAPTPKMMWVLYGGGLAVVLVLLSDWLGIADVRPAVSGLFVLILAEAGGWIKRDSSSPDVG
jgi:hypothetical protein